MSVKSKDSRQALKHLWGEFVPSLTPEEVELATRVWQKIQVRKLQQKKLEIIEGVS